MSDSTLHDKATRAADIASLIEPHNFESMSVSFYGEESGVRIALYTYRPSKQHELDGSIAHMVDLWGEPTVHFHVSTYQLVWHPEEDVTIVVAGDVNRWLATPPEPTTPAFRLPTVEAVAS